MPAKRLLLNLVKYNYITIRGSKENASHWFILCHFFATITLFARSYIRRSQSQHVLHLYVVVQC